MRNFVLILLISVVLASCATTPKPINNSSSLTDKFNQPQDLSKIIYAGDDGSTFENRIIIKNAKNEFDGVASEYAFIAKKHGQKNVEWKTIMQSSTSQSGRKLDIIEIQITPKNETKLYYFDITEFYGKF